MGDVSVNNFSFNPYRHDQQFCANNEENTPSPLQSPAPKGSTISGLTVASGAACAVTAIATPFFPPAILPAKISCSAFALSALTACNTTLETPSCNIRIGTEINGTIHTPRKAALTPLKAIECVNTNDHTKFKWWILEGQDYDPKEVVNTTPTSTGREINYQFTKAPSKYVVILKLENSTRFDPTNPDSLNKSNISSALIVSQADVYPLLENETYSPDPLSLKLLGDPNDVDGGTSSVHRIFRPVQSIYLPPCADPAICDPALFTYAWSVELQNSSATDAIVSSSGEQSSTFTFIPRHTGTYRTSIVVYYNGIEIGHGVNENIKVENLPELSLGLGAINNAKSGEQLFYTPEILYNRGIYHEELGAKVKVVVRDRNNHIHYFAEGLPFMTNGSINPIGIRWPNVTDPSAYNISITLSSASPDGAPYTLEFPAILTVTVNPINSSFEIKDTYTSDNAVARRPVTLDALCNQTCPDNLTYRWTIERDGGSDGGLTPVNFSEVDGNTITFTPDREGNYIATLTPQIDESPAGTPIQKTIVIDEFKAPVITIPELPVDTPDSNWFESGTSSAFTADLKKGNGQYDRNLGPEDFNAHFKWSIKNANGNEVFPSFEYDGSPDAGRPPFVVSWPTVTTNTTLFLELVVTGQDNSYTKTINKNITIKPAPTNVDGGGGVGDLCATYPNPDVKVELQTERQLADGGWQAVNVYSDPIYVGDTFRVRVPASQITSCDGFSALELENLDAGNTPLGINFRFSNSQGSQIITRSFDGNDYYLTHTFAANESGNNIFTLVVEDTKHGVLHGDASVPARNEAHKVEVFVKPLDSVIGNLTLQVVHNDDGSLANYYPNYEITVNALCAGICPRDLEYNWSINDVPKDDTGPTTSFIPPQAGTYTIKVTPSLNGQILTSKSQEFQIQINSIDPPRVEFIGGYQQYVNLSNAQSFTVTPMITVPEYRLILAEDRNARCTYRVTKDDAFISAKSITCFDATGRMQSFVPPLDEAGIYKVDLTVKGEDINGATAYETVANPMFINVRSNNEYHTYQILEPTYSSDGAVVGRLVSFMSQCNGICPSGAVYSWIVTDPDGQTVAINGDNTNAINFIPTKPGYYTVNSSVSVDGGPAQPIEPKIINIGPFPAANWVLNGKEWVDSNETASYSAFPASATLKPEDRNAVCSLKVYRLNDQGQSVNLVNQTAQESCLVGNGYRTYSVPFPTVASNTSFYAELSVTGRDADNAAVYNKKITNIVNVRGATVNTPTAEFTTTTPYLNRIPFGQINFNAKALDGAATYNWEITEKDFVPLANSIPLDEGQQTSHTFDEPGIYTIKLTVNDSTGQAIDTLELAVEIYEFPKPPYNLNNNNNQPAKVGGTARLIFSPGRNLQEDQAATYEWVITNTADNSEFLRLPATVGNNAINTPTFISTGDYKVDLTVKGKHGAVDAYTVEKTVYISVYDANVVLPTSGFTCPTVAHSGVPFTCSANRVDNNLFNYAWSFDDGTTRSGGTFSDKSFTVTAGQIATRAITLTVTSKANAAVKSTTSQNITVVPTSVAVPAYRLNIPFSATVNTAIPMSVDNLSNPADWTISWQFADGTPDGDGATPQAHSYAETGKYNVVVTLTNVTDPSYIITDSQEITIVPVDDTRPYTSVVVGPTPASNYNPASGLDVAWQIQAYNFDLTTNGLSANCDFGPPGAFTFPGDASGRINVNLPLTQRLTGRFLCDIEGSNGQILTSGAVLYPPYYTAP